MGEFKTYIQKFRRPSILRRGQVGDKRRANWEQKIERSLRECDNIKGIIATRQQEEEAGNVKSIDVDSVLQKRHSAFTTQPLSNQELDNIKYMNFSAERDYRCGERPVIPCKKSIDRQNQHLVILPGIFSNEETETKAIVKDFCDFVEISFNSLSISDETGSHPNTAGSIGVETVWSKEIQIS